MDLLLNDLSLHGQFRDLTTFREAISRVMSLRSLARSFGQQLYSHRNVLTRLAQPHMSLHEALQELPKDEKRSILSWLTRQGPFWEDFVEHSPNLYMSYDDVIATETALGEAAYCNLLGYARALVSISPSSWECSPLKVKIDPDTETETDVAVSNYWLFPELETALREAEAPVTTWSQLEGRARATFQHLSFLDNCYNSLDGQPFSPGAANRVLAVLGVLDQLMGAVDGSGQRTAEGHRLYQDHFTGNKAWFSDSSETEKHKFRKELTFPAPRGTGGVLFCSWHGKVRTPPIRIHFAWPENSNAPLFVAYVGLKITRR